MTHQEMILTNDGIEQVIPIDGDSRYIIKTTGLNEMQLEKLRIQFQEWWNSGFPMLIVNENIEFIRLEKNEE